MRKVRFLHTGAGAHGSTPESLRALLTAAGFTDVVVDPIDVVYEWPSVPDFITFLKEVAAPLTALISPNPPAVQDEIWAAIANAVAPEAGESAPLRLAAQSLLAAGHVA